MQDILTPEEQKIVQFGAANGKSVDEVKTAIAKYRQQGTATPQPKEEGLLTKVAKGVGNFIGGAVYGVSAPGRTIQNAIGLAPEATKEGFQNATGVDLNTTSGKVGEFVGEVAPYIAQPGAGLVKGGTAIAGRAAMNTAIGTAQTGDLKNGLAVGVGGEILGASGKLLKSVGGGVFKLSVPLSAKEAALVQTYKAKVPFVQRISAAIAGESKAPLTNAKTAFDKGLWGSEAMMGVQATKAKTKIWKDVVSPALKNSDASVNLPTFFSEAEAQIIKRTPELTRQKALLNALEAVKDDYSGTHTISLEKLQDLKAGWAQFVPEKAYKGENIAGALNAVRNVLAGDARKAIYNAVDDPAVKRAYLDYGNLVNIQKWGQKSMTGGKLKGGFGGWISAIKDTVVIPVTSISGHTIYKTGAGLELYGAAGAKTVEEVLNQSND
jgi:hypothetical protein